MPQHIAPGHLNRASRRWFAKYGAVSVTDSHEWTAARFGPSPTGWYWQAILARRPLTTIVMQDGRVVAVR